MGLLPFFPFFSCGLRPWPSFKEHFPVFGLFWPPRSRFSQFLFRSAISSLCTARGFQSQLRLIWSVGAESGVKSTCLAKAPISGLFSMSCSCYSKSYVDFACEISLSFPDFPDFVFSCFCLFCSSLRRGFVVFGLFFPRCLSALFFCLLFVVCVCVCACFPSLSSMCLFLPNHSLSGAFCLTVCIRFLCVCWEAHV